MNQRPTFGLFLLAVITYSQNVKPILDARCIECHSAGNNLNLASFPFTSNLPGDQSTIVEKILTRLKTIPVEMPPGNRPKLSQDSINTIQQWLDQGLAP